MLLFSNFRKTNYNCSLKLMFRFITVMCLICNSFEVCKREYLCREYYFDHQCKGGFALWKCIYLTNLEEEMNRLDKFNIIGLHISNSNIYQLQSGHFGYWDNLEMLWLPNNNISLLETNLFHPFTNLQEINLTNNNIKTISKQTFSHIYSLSVLDLSHNQIQVVDNDIFTGTDCLDRLYLNHNQIYNITPLIFSCRSISVLDLSNNRLQDLQFIKNCTKLRVLNVASNNLNHFFRNELSHSSFNRLLNLTELNFTSNNIETISKGIFNNKFNLSVLDLSHNQIQTIADHSFTGTDHLDRLYLNDNRIYNATALISNCKNLTVLDLSCNRLEDMQFIKNCTQLRIINVSSNNLSIFFKSELSHGLFNGLLNLQELDFTNNNIKAISAGIFSGMYNLSVLDLSHNQIQSFASNIFTGTENLQRLYFNDDQTYNTTALTDNCKSLIVLNLSNNRLKDLQFIKNCTQLQILDVASNNLSNFFESELSPTITSLDISDNNLSYIDKADLSNLNTLMQLNLSGNWFFEKQDMPVDLFQSINLLKALNLSSTSIKRLIVGIFSQMRSLKVLDLSSNNLTYLPNSLFHDLISLNDLYLANNRLSHFSYDGPKLYKIDLNGNLWNCDLLSSIINRLKYKHVLRGTSYNTTNIYGIACDEGTKDFGRKKASNTSDINDLQNEYLSHLIKTHNELRETFGRLRGFLEQFDQNRKGSLINERIDAILLHMKAILNEIRSSGQNVGVQQIAGFPSAKAEVSVSTEVIKPSTPLVTIRSDTIALYCIAVIQLAMFALFIYKQFRRYKNPRTRIENNTLNSLVV